MDAIAEVVRVFDNDKIIHVYNKNRPVGRCGGGGDGAYFGGFGNSQQESRRAGKRSQVRRQRDCQKLEAVKKVKTALEQGKMAKDCSLKKGILNH